MRGAFVLLMINFSFAFGQNMEEIREKIKQAEKASEELVKEQLAGYNDKDIDKFLRPYSDSVRVTTFPHTLNYIGKTKMKEIYKRLFKAHPKLKCEIVNRIIFGNKVVDRERITGFDKAGRFPDNWVMDALAIYTVNNNVITEVCFVNQLDN